MIRNSALMIGNGDRKCGPDRVVSLGVRTYSLANNCPIVSGSPEPG